jgi:cytochrome b561
MTVNNERYTATAILLHWIMAVLIFVLFGLGWYMVDLPKGSAERSWFFALHKSIGLTTALLVLVRVLWRYFHRPPALPAHISSMQRRVVDGVHHLFYVFMFVQPVSGYISSSFAGYGTRFWGLPLPDWGWKDQVLNELFTDVHVASSVMLLLLIVLHLGGVLFHVFVVRDNVLRRMWPFRLQ